MAQAETTLIEDNEDQIETESAELLEEDQIEDQNDSDEDENADDDDDDQEIVLDGDEGSHPKDDENHGIRKRINKLNAKVAKAETGQEQSTADLEVERERNRLLQLALDQQAAPVDGPPDPDDFDNGVADAEYIKAFQAHIAKGVMSDMMKAQQTTRVQTETDSALNARQVAHYQKAATLRVKDYDEIEDKAIAVLGQKVTNELIKEFDKSPEILYYLGKNPAELNRINAFIQDNKTMRAVARIGVLEDRLKTRPKAKINHAPSPDGELSGGGSGRPQGKRGPKGATFE